MKRFKEFEEAYGRRHDAYTRDYHNSISGMGKHQSAAYHADGGANDEGWGHGNSQRHERQPDHPHSVHINGKKWKTFGSHSHASNVARKIKGATVHRESVDMCNVCGQTPCNCTHISEEKLNELSSGLLQRYKDKAMAHADKLSSAGHHAKANKRLLAHMKATGKQIEKTTANIKKALQ